MAAFVTAAWWQVYRHNGCSRVEYWQYGQSEPSTSQVSKVLCIEDDMAADGLRDDGAWASIYIINFRLPVKLNHE